MIETADKALLPTGLRDVLPPEAALEAHVVDRIGAVFAAHGYERVKPPLIEFEESLLDGVGAATAKATFRVMDPLSQRMMGLRADMTTQVARIATTRLTHAPRPLRLAYAGQVLRVKGDALRPRRQFTQAGLELIGSDSPAADAEAVLLPVAALRALGVEAVSVDLTLPTLVPTLCDALEIPREARGRLRDLLNHKDVAGVRGLLAPMDGGAGDLAGLFGDLIACAGEAGAVLARLGSLDLPRPAAERRDRLAQVVAQVRAAMPDLTITVDAVESRGSDYHTGISFSLFARGAAGELGQGGRYRAGANREKAVGATLYVDAIVAILPPLPAPRRLLLAPTDRAHAARFQAEGWVTLAALEDGADLPAEARRLRCAHYAIGGVIHAVSVTEGN